MAPEHSVITRAEPSDATGLHAIWPSAAIVLNTKNMYISWLLWGVRKNLTAPFQCEVETSSRNSCWFLWKKCNTIILVCYHGNRVTGYLLYINCYYSLVIEWCYIDTVSVRTFDVNMTVVSCCLLSTVIHDMRRSWHNNKQLQKKPPWRQTLILSLFKFTNSLSVLWLVFFKVWQAAETILIQRYQRCYSCMQWTIFPMYYTNKLPIMMWM